MNLLLSFLDGLILPPKIRLGRLVYIRPPNHCDVLREQLATLEALIKEIKKHNPNIEISIFALAMAKK
jgi:hypothetical protein